VIVRVRRRCPEGSLRRLPDMPRCTIRVPECKPIRMYWRAARYYGWIGRGPGFEFLPRSASVSGARRTTASITRRPRTPGAMPRRVVLLQELGQERPLRTRRYLIFDSL